MPPLYVHEAPPLRVEGRPKQTDHRLYQDIKFYRSSKRAGGKGEPSRRLPNAQPRVGFQLFLNCLYLASAGEVLVKELVGLVSRNL